MILQKWRQGGGRGRRCYFLMWIHKSFYQNKTQGTSSTLINHEKKLNLCTPFNNNAPIHHERHENHLYFYNLYSTVYKILKYVHIFIQKEKNIKIKGGNREENPDFIKMQQLLMCYTSIYTHIPRTWFLKVTQEILKLEYIVKEIQSDTMLYANILNHIMKCASTKEEVMKEDFYFYSINILCILLKRTNFGDEYYERKLLIDCLEEIKNEKETNAYVKPFSFLLSGISNYRKQLQKISNQNYVKNVLQEEKRITLLQASSCLLEIFTTLEKYSALSDIDVCNIFKFLHECKEVTHNKIKERLIQRVHKYFNSSSHIHHLCFFLFCLTREGNPCKQSFQYLYDLIYLKIKEIKEVHTLHLLIISLVKWRQIDKNKKIQQKNNHSRHKKNVLVPYNPSFLLCLKLKRKIKKRKKKMKDRNLYFFIKQYFVKLVKRMKVPLTEAQLNSFYKYFIFYHINQKNTRKRGYISPLHLVIELKQKQKQKIEIKIKKQTGNTINGIKINSL